MSFCCQYGYGCFVSCFENPLFPIPKSPPNRSWVKCWSVVLLLLVPKVQLITNILSCPQTPLALSNSPDFVRKVAFFMIPYMVSLTSKKVCSFSVTKNSKFSSFTVLGCQLVFFSKCYTQFHFLFFLLQKILNFKFRSSGLSICSLFKMLHPISFPVFSVR